MNLTGAETAPNVAEIYIEEDRVRLVLDIHIGAIESFEALLPDDWQSDETPERFRFVTESGETLRAALRLVEPRLRKGRFSPFAGMINPVTRQPVPEAPADKRVLYAEIDYPFDEWPETLTVSPPRDGEGSALVTIGFIAYHKAVPIIDFRYLSRPVTLQLDWQDPWV